MKHIPIVICTHITQICDLPTITMSRWIAAIALLAAASSPNRGDAFTTPSPSALRSTKTSMFASIGIFYGTTTGETEEAANMIKEELGEDASEPISIDGIRGSVAKKFAEYDSLIVGAPTWNTDADSERSGTGWDDVYYSEMQVNLQVLFVLHDYCCINCHYLIHHSIFMCCPTHVTQRN